MLTVISMVTMGKIAIKSRQKEMRRDFKHFTTKKNQLNTKEDRNAWRDVLQHDKYTVWHPVNVILFKTKKNELLSHERHGKWKSLNYIH